MRGWDHYLNLAMVCIVVNLVCIVIATIFIAIAIVLEANK